MSNGNEGVEYPDDAPDQLYTMRLVSVGNVPQSAYGRYLDEWYKAKPIAFVEKLTELEIRYWSSKKAGEAVAGGGAKPLDGDVCPCCGEVYWSPGCERPLEAAREWLAKNT